MATTRRVVELGRQARTDSAVKVRQPLARALVTVPPAEREGLAQLVDEIADELNVKQIELSDGTGDLVERSVKPNFRALGPAFQKRAPQVAGALQALDAEASGSLAASLADTGEAVVDVDGEPVTVDPGHGRDRRDPADRLGRRQRGQHVLRARHGADPRPRGGGCGPRAGPCRQRPAQGRRASSSTTASSWCSP
jgi:hypothetical protein